MPPEEFKHDPNAFPFDRACLRRGWSGVSTDWQAGAKNSAINQGDEKERAACHPDVVKFCKELIKDGADADVFGILSCLQTNRRKISKACNEVLASHGQ